MSDNNTTIRFGVDASGVQSGVGTIRTEMPKAGAAFMDAGSKAQLMARALQEAAANGQKATERQVNSLVSQMTRYSATVGKSRGELLAMNAAAMGMAESFAPVVAQMNAAESATKRMGHASAGASRELLVMAHEALMGNFSRLVGSVMVLGERFDIMGKLAAVGGTATVGALAAVGAAVYEFMEGIASANTRFDAFNAAMKGTTGYAQQTRESVQDLAESLAQRFGVSVGEATDDLNQLVATGKVTADVFPEVGTVATAMAKSTGEAFDKVLDSLIRQQDDVKKAAEEYQASHHSMTDAQMSLIDSLTKAGQAHAAYTVLVQQELADAERATKESTAHLASFWDDATAGIQRYFRALAGKSTDLDALNDLKAKQSAQQEGRAPGDYTDYGQLIAAQQKIVDGNRAEQKQAAESAGQNALLADSLTTVQAEMERTLSPQQRLTAAITRDNAVIDTRINLLSQAGKLTDSARTQLEAQRKQMIGFDTDRITPQRKNSGKGEVAATNADASNALQLRNLAEQHEQQQLQLLRQMGLVSAEEYYRKLHDIEARALQDDIDTEQKRVNALSKFQGSAAYKEASGKLGLLKQQMGGLDQTRDDSIAESQHQDKLGTMQFQAGLNNDVRSQQAGFSHSEDTQFMSAQMKQEYDQRYQIIEQFEQKVNQLKDQYALLPDDKQKELQDRLQRLQQAKGTELQQQQAYLAQQQQTANSYQDQMKIAVAQLSGNGETAAQATGAAFTSAWQDSTNALNTFLTTGKGNFDQFVSGVLADTAKIVLQFAEMQAMQGLLGAIGGGSGGSSSSLFGLLGSAGTAVAGASSGGSNTYGFHLATGGHVAGPGSGTSDSIPAMLSNGEYVINAAATKKYRGVLDSINSGSLSHFATGGPVGSVSSSSGSGGGGSNPVSVTVNHNGGGGLSDEDAKQLHTVVQSFVDQRMAFQMKRQGGYGYQIRHGMI